MGALLLLGLALGLDNLRVAVALGALGLLRRQMLKLALMFGMFEVATPLVGVTLGKSIGESIGSWVRYLCPVALASIAIALIVDRSKPSSPPRVDSKLWFLLIVPFSLSLDNLAAGFALGLLQPPVLVSALVIGTISGLISLVGLGIATFGSVRLGIRGEVLAGSLLLVSACLVLLEEIP